VSAHPDTRPGFARVRKVDSGRIQKQSVRVENTFLGAEQVGERTEQRLWEQGATRWEAFDRSYRGIGSTRAERIEQYIDGGRDALADGDVDFFHERFPTRERWRLYESFRERTCFFDIETTGLDADSSVVTTVTLHQNGETQTLVRGDDLTRERLGAAFEPAALLVTFNGARFDIPFLRSSFGLDLDRPHIDLLPTCRRAGLRGGLDTVEDRLGIDRALPDIGGRDAIRLWRNHERGVDGALEKLIAYNREDTENMVPVLEQTIDRLDRELLPDETVNG
jgi:uncharacterized protein YprB with RNaseH-like and TPR domain